MDSQQRILVSSHGKKLIKCLVSHDLEVETAEETSRTILHILNIDPLSVRYCQPETGNNGFHLLLSSRFWNGSNSLSILEAMLRVGSIGLRKQNNSGFLPLHLYLMQPNVDSVVVNAILSHSPEVAGFQDGDGFIPLFYYVMREDACANICKMLCKAFPQGPSSPNRSNSFPLHFAAKRNCPNIEILQILLRRNPSAAAHANDFGLLPLHCLCASSFNVEALKLLIHAFPEGVMIKDRQGRLPLHLAVLAVGKSHTIAIHNEENMEHIGEINIQSGDKHSVPSATIDRSIVKYLINVEPNALVTFNNFEALPVDTVLQRVKAVKMRRRTILIYGLYDDTITARILLIAHKSFSKMNIIPFPNKYQDHLRNLNWIARRDSLRLSYEYEPIPGSDKYRSFKEFMRTFRCQSIHENRTLSKSRRSSQQSAEHFAAIIEGDDSSLPNNNVLAKLRRRGFLDLIRHVVLFL